MLVDTCLRILKKFIAVKKKIPINRYPDFFIIYISHFLYLRRILKARAAFLYIDIEYPVKRKEECLSSGTVSFIITDQDLLLLGWKMLKPVPKIIDLKIYERFNPEFEIARPPAFYKELAYVIHTSGSTGTPKAVFVHHHCIIPNILDLRF